MGVVSSVTDGNSKIHFSVGVGGVYSLEPVSWLIDQTGRKVLPRAAVLSVLDRTERDEGENVLKFMVLLVFNPVTFVQIKFKVSRAY